MLASYGSRLEVTVSIAGHVNLDPPPLLQVCNFVREESIGTFNKRLTAMLAEKENRLAAGKLKVARYMKRLGARFNWQEFTSVRCAERQLGRKEAKLKRIRGAVEEERRKLRAEGYQF